MSGLSAYTFVFWLFIVPSEAFGLYVVCALHGMAASLVNLFQITPDHHITFNYLTSLQKWQ